MSAFGIQCQFKHLYCQFREVPDCTVSTVTVLHIISINIHLGTILYHFLLYFTPDIISWGVLHATLQDYKDIVEIDRMYEKFPHIKQLFS